MRVRGLVGAALGLLGGAALRPAHAQDAETFELSGSLVDGQPTLQRLAPFVGPKGSWGVGAGLVYARNPLVEVLPDGTQRAVVPDRVGSPLLAAYSLGFLRVDASIPLYPTVSTEAGGSFAFGQLRLAATVPLVAPDAPNSDGIGVVVSPYLLAPTASDGAFLSNGGTGGGVLTAFGGRHGRVGWTGEVGADLSKGATIGRTALGTGLDLGAGVWFGLSEAFRLGLELDGRRTLGETVPGTANPMEGHLYGHYGSCEGLFITGAVGTGIIAGVGAPDLRVASAVGWRASACGGADADGDGIVDEKDACPAKKEDMDGFEDADGCPDDNDKDGVADALDSCPSDPGPERSRGCPDRDGDLIADGVDACPDEPGPTSANGCPDADTDRVPDTRDRCPAEPIDPRTDPARSDGCPDRVVVTKQELVILDRVFFETNEAVILPASFPILDRVAAVLQEHTDLMQVEVQGHTDDVGADETNQALSQRRAEAVRQYLIGKGVSANRLVARGYGESVPLVADTTETAREQNRRVEFKILAQ